MKNMIIKSMKIKPPSSFFSFPSLYLSLFLYLLLFSPFYKQATCTCNFFLISLSLSLIFSLPHKVFIAHICQLGWDPGFILDIFYQVGMSYLLHPFHHLQQSLRRRYNNMHTKNVLIWAYTSLFRCVCDIFNY